MIVIEDNFKIHLKEKTYIALGSFDGLHLGHMQLVKKAIELSKGNNAKSMVFTFKSHPRNIINKKSATKILMNNESKLEVLKESGLDIINMASFDYDFMKISPKEFIIKLIQNYNAKGLVVGFNYRFGYKNMGNIELLKELSVKYKFSLDIIKPVKFNDNIISSTIIRNLIADQGDVKQAANMLSRPYMLQGKIIQGKHLGKKLGFPTANMEFDTKFILPKEGVYFTAVKFENKFYKGITNVGYNPTTNDNKLSVETNILDFNKDIYGSELRIYFIDRIRDEFKFQNLDQLISQLESDRNYANKKNLEINF
ncbi:bifunctional riboflavin kinase/FAD synthetase [Clostridium tyrobutyricum]|uniref:bifunctional riboflavin kinase/FAD synthetase n=1 Tax=Clostridium tyrobutyricum TaxID=1519 RepID=UPI001C383CC0|nr:bifunctional riboflavin kinase/FAD synthetase [Clostridium tyrobutyricum]MBV4426704.1 bifunctional riboflavin kinase/FAD synthetase [Clostridium tyrobutyricum]MBV4441860.1 bifunctional riboflavin kinase/FAD synthetase [Clostridium tyrobutyricum]